MIIKSLNKNNNILTISILFLDHKTEDRLESIRQGLQGLIQADGIRKVCQYI